MVVVVVVVCGWQWCNSQYIPTDVRVTVSTLGSPPSTSLPGGVARDVFLEVSGVGDRDVGLACDIIAAMSPSDGEG